MISDMNKNIDMWLEKPHSQGLSSYHALPGRERQKEVFLTKGLISKTIAVHVRYKSLYISLPSSAKQQREMTKFCAV